MIYAKVIMDDVQEIGTLQQLFPNTSFPDTGVDGMWLSENHLLPVIDYKETDPSVERFENCDPYRNGPEVHTFKIIPLTDNEKEQYQTLKTIAQWNGIRYERDVRLHDTDWSQLPDVPEATRNSFVAYRQALRDITTQTDPFNIDWPVKP